MVNQTVDIILLIMCIVIFMMAVTAGQSFLALVMLVPTGVLIYGITKRISP
jgi:hypothetical protein